MNISFLKASLIWIFAKGLSVNGLVNPLRLSKNKRILVEIDISATETRTKIFIILSYFFCRLSALVFRINTPFCCGSTCHYSHYSPRFIKCVLSHIVLTAIYLSQYTTDIYTHIPSRHTIFQVERHGWSYASAGDIVIVIQTDVARKHIAGACGKSCLVLLI